MFRWRNKYLFWFYSYSCLPKDTNLHKYLQFNDRNICLQYMLITISGNKKEFYVVTVSWLKVHFDVSIEIVDAADK